MQQEPNAAALAKLDAEALQRFPDDAMLMSVDDDTPDTHRNAPRPDPACLYGLIGEIAQAGAKTTEANPYAVALNLIAYLSAAAGRVSYMPVGNTWHHPRISGVHVGRTGRGRKGDAASLISRIDHAIKRIDETIAPQVHRGGLSSREGLACLIHDGYKEGQKEVEPIHDKRLYVVESEFGNILSQTKREGNTLSTAIRDIWDGVSIRPATKSSRIWATDPHVTISGAITPGELRTMMASKELTNGFANRFLFAWAERHQVLPFPKATAQQDVDAFAKRIVDLLRHSGSDRFVETDSRRMELSSAAQKQYAKLYLGELNTQDLGDLCNALLERRAPMLLRLSMLFAICDLSEVVDVPHITAALAWVRYWVDSVKFVFSSAVDEVAAAEASENAKRIVNFLSGREHATRSAITSECFKGHKTKDTIDQALDELLSTTPPTIEVQTLPSMGRAAKVYRLMGAKDAKLAKDEHWRGLQPDSAPCEASERSERSPDQTETDETLFRNFRILRETENQPETRADAHSSPLSLISQSDADEVEVL